MPEGKRGRAGRAERVARAATRFTGGGAAFLVALALVVVWLLTGPLFGYARLAAMAARDGDLLKSHSIEEADARHETKLRPRRGPHATQGPQQRQKEHGSEESDQPPGR